MKYKVLRYQGGYQFVELSATEDLSKAYATRDRLQAGAILRGATLNEVRYGIYPVNSYSNN